MRTLIAVAAVLTLAACEEEADAGRVMKARATLVPTGTVPGLQMVAEATFTVEGERVILKLQVDGAPPGPHGVHLHAVGDCGLEGMAAGGHWNPGNMAHGRADGAHHAGDIGNVLVGADGRAEHIFETREWAIGSAGPTDPIGKAIIFHAGADDFATQPTGNSGGRIACGVVTAI